MAIQLSGLCSMATRRLLDDLARGLRRRGRWSVTFEAAGGVDVAEDIRSGADADLVVLSGEQIAGLEAEGLCATGTARPLFVSDVVAAVPQDATRVPFSTEEDLRAVLSGAGRIAYSTGPSGTAFLDLLERWGLTASVGHRLVQAEPGTPVGSLLAAGDADLGLQQRSELSGLAGVLVLGPLPGAAAIRSTFSGAVLARSAHPQVAREVLDLLGSREAERLVLARGMALARGRGTADVRAARRRGRQDLAP